MHKANGTNGNEATGCILYQTRALGGEEFVILLPHSDKENAFKLAEQMRKGVEEKAIPHLYSDISDHVIISLGVNSIIPSDESSIVKFMSHTDKALYKAKESRNCSVSTA